MDVGPSGMDVSSSSSIDGDGSFSFIWASERSGFMHLYLYKYVPGADRAVEVRQITSGEWVVEFVVGVDQVSLREGQGGRGGRARARARRRMLLVHQYVRHRA